MSAFRRRKINLPKTVGARLKKERRRQKLTLDDVEEATKIRLRYLKALEADHFDQFPPLVYMLGFVRRYAKFLALENDEIADPLSIEVHPSMSKVLKSDHPPLYMKTEDRVLALGFHS